MEKCCKLYSGVFGIEERQFKCLWFGKNTRCIIYTNLLALVMRMNDSEKLIHTKKCASCQINRIEGIRFDCMKCKKLSLCMKCFAIGFFSQSHGKDHVMFEVFTHDLPYQIKPKNINIFKKLCSALCFRRIDVKYNICENLLTENNINSDFEKDYTSLDNKSSNKGFIKKLGKIEKYFFRNIEFAKGVKTVSDAFSSQNDELIINISALPHDTRNDFVRFHHVFLENTDFDIEQGTRNPLVPTSSTPRRTSFALNKQDCVKDKLFKSVYGASINSSYLEANKSNYSVNDLNSFYKSNTIHFNYKPTNSNDNTSCLQQFHYLLQKVEIILEHTYKE
ncbi:hypothetical protein ACFFRR_001101 [Megaselia abdita]